MCRPNEVTFLDRSLVDTVAYAQIERRNIPEEILLSMGNLGGRYHHVLELEPLPKYVNSEFRPVDQDYARELHQRIIETYKQYGYAPIVVPPLPIAQRRDFVIDALGL